MPIRLATIPLLGALGGCSTSATTPATTCGSPANASCPGPNPPWQVIVAASDEEFSSDLVYARFPSASEAYSPFALGNDPVITTSAGRYFWINRTLGTVLELDPTCGAVLHGPWTTNADDAGGSTDPQDLAVAPDGSVWVARYMVSSLLVKCSDGSTDLGTIDLSHVAGVNRNPYMSAIRIVGGKAYVVLEMLYPYPEATQPAYLVKLDVATALKTGQVEGALELKGKNPFGPMIVSQDETAIYLAEPGSFDAGTETNAGIERVDLASWTSDLVVTENRIGASVVQLALNGSCGVAIVAGTSAANVTSLVSFNASTGALVSTLSNPLLTTPAGFKLGGLTWRGDGGTEVVVGDGTLAPNEGYPLHVLAASPGCSFTEASSAMFMPLPPVGILALP
jgi:hypothetical protein